MDDLMDAKANACLPLLNACVFVVPWFLIFSSVIVQFDACAFSPANHEWITVRLPTLMRPANENRLAIFE
jgi:hypothetical protein